MLGFLEYAYITLGASDSFLLIVHCLPDWFQNREVGSVVPCYGHTAVIACDWPSPLQLARRTTGPTSAYPHHYSEALASWGILPAWACGPVVRPHRTNRLAACSRSWESLWRVTRSVRPFCVALGRVLCAGSLYEWTPYTA